MSHKNDEQVLISFALKCIVQKHMNKQVTFTNIDQTE